MKGELDFENRSTLTIQKRSPVDNGTLATSAQVAPLVFHFDPASGTYTLTSNGQTTSFGPGDLREANGSGDADYFRETANAGEFLTLINPARFGAGTEYVSAGLWQRIKPDRDGSGDDFEFDTFVYGFPTASASRPVSGTAIYDVELIAFASPIGEFPRSVLGNGVFSVDFAQGLFGMNGEAGEYNNDVDYSVCCMEWQGAGYIGSDGLLSGRFSYQGREFYGYEAEIGGSFYGPSGQEVGATLVGEQLVGGGTITGVIAGTNSGLPIDTPLSALSTGDRTYGGLFGTSSALQKAGQGFSDSGAYYYPARFGKLDFGGDGSFTLYTGINDERFQDVTFSAADLVASQSDNRFKVYEVNNSNGNYRLELFQPGAANPEIQLTYSSFGHWEETRSIGEAARQSLSTWFAYGVPTPPNSQPHKGSAHYESTILGSGERYIDANKLTISGLATIDIDFAAMSFEGVFDADARTSTNELIDLPVLTFGGEMVSTNGFESYLFDYPGHAPGTIQGRLFGPRGEEIGGTFDFITRVVEGGDVDATYSGVFYGKRN